MNIQEKLILCGFMSSGKTTVGHLLSEALGIPFYDTDQMLFSKNNMTTAQIFEKGGEGLFRDLEHDIAKDVAALPVCVVSTGGGMLIQERNAAILKASGTVIYIRRPFENCYGSIEAHPDRPLFKKYTKEQLETTYRMRDEIYSRHAALSVLNNTTPTDTLKRLLSALKKQNLIP